MTSAKPKPQSPFEPEFHGATVVGERGQVVIPAEARKAHDLQKGEKLLVFSVGESIVLTRLSGLESREERLARKLRAVRDIIEKNR